MYDVVIAGAGPVGLLLAGELGLAGCSVLVLEREPDTDTPWRAAALGMRGLSAASVEAFYRRGLLEPLRAAAKAQYGFMIDPDADDAVYPHNVGHFAGIVLDPEKVNVAALPFRLPAPAMQGVPTSLAVLEGMLAERAVKLGVEIRYGAEVSAVEQGEESVVVRAGEQEYEARWLVGCDGGRSAVRRLAGFEFAGTEPQLTGYVMLSTLADPAKLNPGFNLTPTGMYIGMPTAGHIGMMDFDGGAFDRSQEPNREHLQTVLRRVSGTDVTVADVSLASTFTDRARQTTTYRQGRVLLAGDAAHIHSPLGGQGLNTGIGDAVNLGWKLAATVRGSAPAGLLDTYQEERHPIGAWVVEWTRAQVSAMRPDPHGQAMQGLIRDLLSTRDGTTYVYEKLSGLAIRYDLGSTQPLVGRSAPDFHLADGTHLGDLLAAGRGVLLDFTGTLRESAQGWETRVQHVAGPAQDTLGLGAALVRPDGVIAWAGDPDPDRRAFETAATRWFGDPSI
ncbi:FAD-dependent oxidoreductase [Kutzneria sp. CA-103260]|uniref:FAD-dependent oxidoreductase n=1 Tax=Kutzneria sp. CA-103260 TaxID=2802641 RepID=UPI001BA76654|nr:FAD-dependent oxidoreductase [Kutzneria sp. CA-103260]QUQ68779.1 FAD-dependent oxidoreductase [Kutzneria sp. CA-103260]